MEHLLLSCIESRVENNRSLYGRFQLGPFDRGQGVTVANAMRRTLLSELSGLAILCVEIQGVSHEYSNLKGVRESVLDILLNLKQLVFISDEKFNQPEIGFLKIQGPAIIKASDLKLPTFIQCVDPDQYIATLSDDGVLEMKFMICKGKNFLVQTSVELIQKHFQSHFHGKKKNQDNVSCKNNFAQQSLNSHGQKKQSVININSSISKKKIFFAPNQTDFQSFEKNLISHKKKHTELQPARNLLVKQDLKEKTFTNVLFIDAIFMPIKKVNFSIQNINDYSNLKQFNLVNKLQQNYSQEKIILEIWTNGSVYPRHAIYQAAHKIIDILIPFQKTYSYKKTKLAVKPMVSAKALFDSTNQSGEGFFINDLNSSVNFSALNWFDKTLNIEKNKTPSFIPILSKIYRPWQTSTKSINLKNYLYRKKKRNIGYHNLMYGGKKIELNQSTDIMSFIGIKHQLKSVDIAYLNLSAKSYICLKRANINTIKNLVSYSRNELLLIKNLGEKSVKQIETALAKMNFILGSKI